MKKRRLSDLYVVGKEVTFDDGRGEPIVVYVRKLSPVDQETALRKANAARARMLAVLRDKDSDEYQAVRGQAEDIGEHDALVDFVVAPKLLEYRTAREAELAAEEEWSKDDYLQGISDAWEEGLKERHFIDPDSETEHVFKELERFAAQVDKMCESHKKDLYSVYKKRSLEQLIDNAAEAMIAVASDSLWVREYRRCEVWLSVFETDKRTRYFADRSEIDFLSIEVLTQLVEAYQSLEVNPIEGKSSRETASSSQPSEPPATEEVTSPSGLEVAPA